MKGSSLRGFYISELKKAHDAETQLITALETVSQSASSSDLRRAFEDHLDQTKDHAARLQMMLEAWGEKPEGNNCEGMKGLITEMLQLQSADFSPGVLDSALIAYAQRIEHYEIAIYGTLRDYATALGERDSTSQLQNTLEEEKEADRLLTKIGQAINEELARKESAEKNQRGFAPEQKPSSTIKPAA